MEGSELFNFQSNVRVQRFWPQVLFLFHTDWITLNRQWHNHIKLCPNEFYWKEMVIITKLGCCTWLCWTNQNSSECNTSILYFSLSDKTDQMWKFCNTDWHFTYQRHWSNIHLFIHSCLHALVILRKKNRIKTLNLSSFLLQTGRIINIGFIHSLIFCRLISDIHINRSWSSVEDAVAKYLNKVVV